MFLATVPTKYTQGYPKSAWITGKSHVHADSTLWDLASEEWHHTDTHWVALNL